MHARPDFFVKSEDARWLLEIKSTRKFDHRWEGVPPYYLTQCIWQMAVTDDERCDLAAFATMNDEYRSFKIYRDASVESKMIDYVRDWYDRHIREGKPPEVDGSTACSRSLAKLFEQESKEFIEPSEAHLDLAMELKEVRRMSAELDEKKRMLENKIKEEIGTAYGISGVATWSQSKPRSRFDRTSFEADHPELAKSYVKLGEPTRTFRFQYTGESK